MLQVSSLLKVYPGPVAALQGIDLDVPAGLMVNATGEKRSETTAKGRTITEWSEGARRW